MKKIIVATGFSFLLVSLLRVQPTFATMSQWYYPITSAQSRVSVNPFNTLHNAQYYVGKESLFPYNRWSGYHSGTDFETTAAEKDQPVHIYAIGDGTISYVDTVSGYGGLILEKLDDEQHTALYGHLKQKSAAVKVGQHVSGGQYLADLGNQFTAETGMERKHLHLGIYNGQELYFHGYEQSEQTIQSKWVDPMIFLQQHNAIEPGSATTIAPKNSSAAPSATPVGQNSDRQGTQPTFWAKIVSFFRSLFRG